MEMPVRKYGRRNGQSLEKEMELQTEMQTDTVRYRQMQKDADRCRQMQTEERNFSKRRNMQTTADSTNMHHSDFVVD